MIGLIKGTARQIKTVSGLPLPIASYKSNSKSPLKELSLSINPTQSGSGDPAPDNIRPITGVSSVNVENWGKYIRALPTTAQSVTNNGITFTIKSNGQVDINGTATALASATIPVTPFTVFSDDGRTIRFHNTFASSTSNVVFKNGGTTVDSWNLGVLDRTYTNFSALAGKYVDTIQITIPSGATINGSLMVDFNVSGTGNTYTIALGDTYYGGELDIDEDGNVKFRATHWLDEYDGSNDETWGLYSSSGLRYSYFIIRSYTQPAITSAAAWKSNSIPVSLSSENTPEDANRITCRGTAYSSKNLYIFAPPSDIPDLTALRAYLSNQPFQFWYPITPIEIDLGNLFIPSLLGSNNIWHDGNGNVEVLKFMDRQLYFGR